MYKYLLLFFWLLCAMATQAKSEFSIQNQVTDSKSGGGIPWVNIGIAGKNLGTVSNEQGWFLLELNESHARDTIIFSCIGYERVLIPVEVLRSLNISVQLSAQSVQLNMVNITQSRLKQKFFGQFSKSMFFQAGFSDNTLGKECGVLMRSKKPALLDQVQINFGKCTYDSVFFRLNVYRREADGSFTNILPQAIYCAFNRIELLETLAIDLKPYELVVQGDFMISVEYIQDKGPGHLYFKANGSRTTYIRATSQADWHRAPAGVSIGVFALVPR
ncbi:MAG: carboxypeptidase-like regulatory domain-containing protein [Bacteroidia bacterium]